MIYHHTRLDLTNEQLMLADDHKFRCGVVYDLNKANRRCLLPGYFTPSCSKHRGWGEGGGLTMNLPPRIREKVIRGYIDPRRHELPDIFLDRL